MATQQERDAVRLWAADLSISADSRLISDSRLDELLETYRPAYALGGRLIKVVAIEVCNLLATWHRDAHPDEADAYEARAGYLRALPAFQVRAVIAPQVTRYLAWTDGAMVTEAQLKAGITDTDGTVDISTAAGSGVLTFYIWSPAVLTRITAGNSFGGDNLLDTFTVQDYALDGGAGFLYATQLVAGAINTSWQLS